MSAAAIILVGAFLVLLVLGVPISFAMMGSMLMSLVADGFNSIAMAQKLITGMDSLTMLAVPGFLLAGDLMCKGGLAARLIKVADALIGHIRNGLSIVTIVAGMFFSAMNGTAAATTAAIGSLMIPEMKERGYDKDYVAALAAVVGPLGPIIPPSVIMIIYCCGGEVSVGDLFLAGVVPGILLGAALIVCSYIMTRKMDLKVLPKASFRDVWLAFKEGFWSLLTPVIILGGIYGGVCTPTEAAVIAVFYTLIVGLFVYRELNWPLIKECLISTIENSAMVMLIVGAAGGFGWMIAITNVSSSLANGILHLTSNPAIILLLLNLVLILVGCFMDTISAVVIFQTVMLPIAKMIGIDLLQFAAIFIVVVSLGNATPPFGYALFVGARIADSPLEKISKNVLPMCLAMFIVVIFLNIFPVLTIGLPSLF